MRAVMRKELLGQQESKSTVHWYSQIDSSKGVWYNYSCNRRPQSQQLHLQFSMKAAVWHWLHVCMCLQSIVLSSLFESVSLWPWGGIAWQVSAVILACLLQTRQPRRRCSATVSGFPVMSGRGQRCGGSRAAQREGLFTCGLRLWGLLL